MRKVPGILFLTLLAYSPVYSQIFSFPYNEGFESAFTTGTNVDFIPNWNGNTVQTSSRIFRDSINMRTGGGSLGVIPISTFNGTIIVSLSFSTLTNPVANFWARSVQNSTGSKPAIVNFSVSTDGGNTYSSPTQIGTETTFPNASTPYANYIYNFPSSTFTQSSVKLKIVVSPGTTGSGTTARFVMDDFAITGNFVADVTPPTILALDVLSQTSLDVKFSEAVEPISSQTSTNYFANNGIGNPSSATRDASDFSLVHLTFSTSFTPNIQNILVVNNVQDLSANIIQANSAVNFIYYVSEMPQPSDIVINEVLFHAQTGGSEFVELYNASQKVLDLKDIFLYDATASNSLYAISSGRIFLPGDYVAITKNISDVSNRYIIEDPGALIQVASMPSYLDAGDTVTIATDSSLILDRLVYSESWQFPLLNNSAGVSIERLSPNRPTQDSSNWHSAAQSAGFATPGYKNSEYDASQGSGNEVSVEPEIFSPDEDGKDDNVNIHFHFSTPGSTANIQVYDAKGRLVRTLISNELIGNDGTFSWDGVNDKKEKARIGIYVFYMEVFNLNGDTKKYKRTCVLASKL